MVWPIVAAIAGGVAKAAVAAGTAAKVVGSKAVVGAKALNTGAGKANALISKAQSSEIGKLVSTIKGSGAATPSSQPSQESGMDLHPMVEKAISGDMGFYKHMDGSKLPRQPIFGGQNGPLKSSKKKGK